MILGRLHQAGIKAMTKPGTGGAGIGWAAGRARSIYVNAQDFDRAQKVLFGHGAAKKSDPDHRATGQPRIGKVRAVLRRLIGR